MPLSVLRAKKHCKWQKSFASVLVRQYTCWDVGDVLSKIYTQHKTLPFYLHIQGLAFQGDSRAGTTGMVLAIPLFGHLMISRRGLAIQSVGSGTHVVALNWWELVHACNSKWPAAHVSLSWNFLWLLTSCLPESFFHSEPRYRLLAFCYVTDDMESRLQWQCSAKHDGTMRAHPDNRKMKVKKFAHTSRREISATHLYTLPLAVAIPLQKHLAPALDRDECNTCQTTPKLNSWKVMVLSTLRKTAA